MRALINGITEELIDSTNEDSEGKTYKVSNTSKNNDGMMKERVHGKQK